jgi:hypothetical protein
VCRPKTGGSSSSSSGSPSASSPSSSNKKKNEENPNAAPPVLIESITSVDVVRKFGKGGGYNKELRRKLECLALEDGESDDPGDGNDDDGQFKCVVTSTRMIDDGNDDDGTSGTSQPSTVIRFENAEYLQDFYNFLLDPTIFPETTSIRKNYLSDSLPWQARNMLLNNLVTSNPKNQMLRDQVMRSRNSEIQIQPF